MRRGSPPFSDAFAAAAALSDALRGAAAAAATMYTAPSLSLLLAGRVTYGLGIGFGMHAAPAYIAEVCPPQVRPGTWSHPKALKVSRAIFRVLRF